MPILDGDTFSPIQIQMTDFGLEISCDQIAVIGLLLAMWERTLRDDLSVGVWCWCRSHG